MVANRYQRIIELIFRSHHTPGSREVAFARDDLEKAAAALQIALPKNVGDILYSFRFRAALPESVRATAPEGKNWVIRLKGPAKYAFELADEPEIVPSSILGETKIPDATPGIIAKYALSDEQALLAKLRYNRLIDIFTGVASYSLQNHLRTTAPGIGQVEVDEIYVGVDRRGAHYVFPVQAKGGRDKLSIVQMEQDAALCAAKFPDLICRPVAAQFMSEEVIALFVFEDGATGLALSAERHYRLVPPASVSVTDLETYRARES